MKTDAYQIERLRSQFAMRGYHPLNRRRRMTVEHWIGLGLFTAAVVIPAIAAIFLIFKF